MYATGIGPLARLVDTDAETWRQVFDTNVTGAALVTAAAIESLTAASGTAIYLSSVSASLTPPWPGLAAYAVSKAALDKLVEAWRAEHPAVGFTRLVVGDCAGGEGPGMTEFATGWDPQLATELAPVWVERNLLSGSLIDVEHLIEVVDAVLRGGRSMSIPSVTVAPARRRNRLHDQGVREASRAGSTRRHDPARNRRRAWLREPRLERIKGPPSSVIRRRPARCAPNRPLAFCRARP